MTWLGPDVIVRGWTRDGQILFVTTHGQPFFRNYRAFTLDPAGGLPQPLPLGQVNHLAFGPEARKSSAATPRTRRAGSATAAAPPAAVDRREGRRRVSRGCRAQRQHHEPDVARQSHLVPVRPRGRRAISTRARRTAGDLRRHTDHDDFYARHAHDRRQAHRLPVRRATCGCYDPARDAPSALDDPRARARTQAARKFVPAPDFLGGFDLHPAGHSLAVDVRGKLSRSRCGRARCATRRCPTARASPRRWLADGVTSSRSATKPARNAAGLSKDGTTRTLPGISAVSVAMRAAPRGTLRRDRQSPQRGAGRRPRRTEKRQSSIDSERRPHRGPRLVARRRVARVRVLDAARAHCAIKLYRRRATRSATLVTQPEFSDYAPAFDPEGQLSLLPVAAHLRPGLRQPSIRAVASRARRARI